MRAPPPSAILLLVLALCACSPTYDWRETRLGDGELMSLFPCRPDHHRRQVPLAGAARWMNLSSCQAGDTTFAVSMVDAERVDQLGATYDALARSLSTNLGAAPAAPAASASVAGATPHPAAGAVVLEGRRSDGKSVQAHSLMFGRGLHVYQATVLGQRVDPAAAEAFFSALRFPS